MHISTSECLGSLAGNWLGTSTSFKTAKQVGTGIVQGWKINKLKPSTCQLLVYPMIQGPVRHVGQHYPMIQNPEHAQQSRIAAPWGTTSSLPAIAKKNPQKSKFAGAFSDPACPNKAGLVLVRSSKFASNGAMGADSDRADTAAPAGTPSPRDERSRARCHWRPGIAIPSGHWCWFGCNL